MRIMRQKAGGLAGIAARRHVPEAEPRQSPEDLLGLERERKAGHPDVRALREDRREIDLPEAAVLVFDDLDADLVESGRRVDAAVRGVLAGRETRRDHERLDRRAWLEDI